MQHEGRRKKSSSTKKPGVGFKRVEHTEKLKGELRARDPDPDGRNVFPVPDSKGGCALKKAHLPLRV